jgi:hypothetical protein
MKVGHDSTVGTVTPYGLDGRESKPGGVRFSAPVQTTAEVHPAAYTMENGSFPVVKWPKHGINHSLHLVLRSKKEYSYTSAPPFCLHGRL